MDRRVDAEVTEANVGSGFGKGYAIPHERVRRRLGSIRLRRPNIPAAPTAKHSRILSLGSGVPCSRSEARLGIEISRCWPQPVSGCQWEGANRVVSVRGNSRCPLTGGPIRRRLVTRMESVPARIGGVPGVLHGHSHLVLGFTDSGLPVHAVCAVREETLVIVTLYRQDPKLWQDDRIRRQKK